MSKDYYLILGLTKNASEDEIRKSYKKLALQYHPDKNNGNDEATEKFKEIAEAYSVLSNKEKRSQYDVMGNVDEQFGGEDPFSVFNNIFKQHMGSFMNMNYENEINLGDIFSNLSGVNESPFPFGGNVQFRVHTFPQRRSVETVKIKKKGKPDDIIYNINVSFSDIYDKKKKNILIQRIRKKDGEYIEKKKKIDIPIYGKEILLEKEGHELKDYKERGDIIINIFNNPNDNFRRVNEYDMLTYKEINVNQLYSIIIYEIVLPNGEIIKVKNELMNLQNHLIQKISKKGLPYDEECYGNLYVIYKIIFPNNFEDLKNIEKYEEQNNLNDDNYNYAKNCVLDDIFKEI
jgi:DnaJ-class molecular chaperone